jgi:hypothetical protein
MKTWKLCGDHKSMVYHQKLIGDHYRYAYESLDIQQFMEDESPKNDKDKKKVAIEFDLNAMKKAARPLITTTEMELY